MKTLLFALSIPMIIFCGYFFTDSNKSESYFSTTEYPQPPLDPRTNSKAKIQVALLLDTSNSMDGLINQAKSRLWTIVNTLSTLKHKGKDIPLEIALYEYGNSGLSEKSGYIRKVTDFTSDLDLISEYLFSLRTNGGYEYCGMVIKQSIKDLKWNNHPETMKLIYIAGNEEFNQGSVNYKEAINDAVGKNVYVNTIYCGDKNSGIRELWKSGADVGKGKYFNINSNREIRYIPTPYDDEITRLNEKLNTTYQAYGSRGYEYKKNQEMQDNNAKGMSPSVMMDRTVSKSSSKYTNSTWDIVDAYNQDKNFLKNVKDNELPEEFRNLSMKEKEEKVKSLQKERADIQKQISELAKEREKYIKENSNELEAKDDLGYAITESILDFAKKYNFTR